MTRSAARHCAAAAAAIALFAEAVHVLARQPAETVLVNAKIVTVDDKSFEPRVGTIAAAMAVRDGRIVAVGDTAEVRRHVSPNAAVWDLKGRTVLPGLISVHEHPFDWTPVSPPILRTVLSDEDVITRMLEGTPQENLAAFEPTLRAALQKAKAGQWIYIVLGLGRHYEHSAGGNGGFGNIGNANMVDGRHEPITKVRLDALAPDNPVVVRDLFTSMVVNQRAWDLAKKVYPVDDNPDVRFATAGNFRWMFGDIVMRDRYAQHREMQRLGLSWWAGYGFTAFASDAYAVSHLKIFYDLDRAGELPVRSMWGWYWRNGKFFDDEYFLTFLANGLGRGSDYFWFGGGKGAEVVGSPCTTLTPIRESERRTPGRRARCAWDPGMPDHERIYNWIRAGGRFAVTHTAGDRDLDNLMGIIERASRDAGLTPEQIRAKRHAVDHNVMSPRPDQIARMKRLGMVSGGNAFEIHQASPEILATYGERAVEWVVPKKSLAAAGIPNGFEIDRAIPGTDLTAFSVLAMMIHRRGWDGRVYAPSERIGRELALKVITRWGADYLMKEDAVGSLEPGKYADFIVLDRDYMTIPEDDIANIQVLMTVLGGRPTHLVPQLAADLKLQPVGAQVQLAAPAPSSRR